MAETTVAAESPKTTLVYRHTVLTRITHWINVVCITFLILSGLQIFNAHPALYIGQASDFDDPVLSMTRAPRRGRPADRRDEDLRRDLRHDRRSRPLRPPPAGRRRAASRHG